MIKPLKTNKLTSIFVKVCSFTDDPTFGDAYLHLLLSITTSIDDGYSRFIAMDMWMKSKNATI